MCISTTPRASLTSKYALEAMKLYQLDMQQPLVQVNSDAKQASKSRKRNQHQHFTVQHNYHDHSADVRSQYQEERPARGGVTMPFPLKLHDMLNAAASEGLEHIVSWQPHGRCFLVHDPKAFVELLPRFFKLSKLPSFQRQLNLYGFQRLTRGQDRGGYYHELFLRDRVFLSHSIQRIKVKGTGVRARSNPDQEPNFWAMPWITQESKTPKAVTSSSYPLPGGYQSTLPVRALSADMEPRPLPNTFQEQEQDLLVGFGNKTFHYLNNKPENIESEGQYELPTNEEITDFFEDFEFSQDLYDTLEDDMVFGNLLEQMMSSA